ncbi:MAG TPA: ABC transporter permease [Hyphomicrobiales bacterium]|nr:ABC transporter permease [Hyphomicrobiales bacterium]
MADAVAVDNPPRRRLLPRLTSLPWIPLVFLSLLIVGAVFAPLIAPHRPLDPVAVTAAQCKAAYGQAFDGCYIKDDPPFFIAGSIAKTLLGTDYLGRDIFSRLLYGARISLFVSLVGTTFAGVLGTALGLIAGYMGPIWQQIIMRLTDAWLTLPPLIFAILLSTIRGPGIGNIVIILAVVFWCGYTRLVYAEVLSLRQRDFVLLAEINGVSRFRIMRRHLLPNVLNTVVVYFTLIVGVAIIIESILSFLGVGVPPPEPSWGLMIAQERDGLLEGKWWLVAWPGLAIMILVLSANMLGDWLRVRLDPHFQGP